MMFGEPDRSETEKAPVGEYSEVRGCQLLGTPLNNSMVLGLLGHGLDRVVEMPPVWFSYRTERR